MNRHALTAAILTAVGVTAVMVPAVAQDSDPQCSQVFAQDHRETRQPYMDRRGHWILRQRTIHVTVLECPQGYDTTVDVGPWRRYDLTGGRS